MTIPTSPSNPTIGRRTITAPIKDLLRTLARGSRAGFVSVENAAELLGISRRSAALRLARLARQGWVVRVRRGYYLVLPLEAGADPTAIAEDPWILANEIYAPCYIGGWSAAEHWGLTEQLFRSTFVVTTANVRSTSSQLLNLDFRIVRVSPSRLKGTIPVWRGAVRVPVSDREKTLADALTSPDWVGGIRHLYDMLETYFSSEKPALENLLKRLDENGRGAAYKRLGYLVDEFWPKFEPLRIAALARKTKGNIKLDPAVTAKGRLIKQWGVWNNATLGKGSGSP